MADALATQGFVVGTARSGGQCLFMLQEQDYAGILIERDLGDLDAEQLLEQARRENPQLAVIVVSTNGGTQQAVRLAKLGADDYLPAADPPDHIARRLIEVIEERCSKSSYGGEGHLVGRSRAMQRVLDTIRMIAPKRSTVLITGPTGTGKDLVARAIHALSPRAGAAMVTINCGAIPEHLLEAEFFGHVKGAFTGAMANRIGRLEQAHGSTLFLDEIGDMPLELQPKVLRAVQEREFQRVGSSQTIRVDMRVIAATNCDLVEKVRRGQFREDLYYRLNVVPIVMPALAERLEDLPALVDHFLAKICRQEGVALKRAASATVDRLMQYNWPGNIRQLENAVEKAVALSADRPELYPSDFPLPAPAPRISGSAEPEMRLPPGGLDLDALMTRLERSLLEQALERSGGNKRQAAEMLGLKRTTLSAKLRKPA